MEQLDISALDPFASGINASTGEEIGTDAAAVALYHETVIFCLDQAIAQWVGEAPVTRDSLSSCLQRIALSQQQSGAHTFAAADVRRLDPAAWAFLDGLAKSGKMLSILDYDRKVSAPSTFHFADARGQLLFAAKGIAACVRPRSTGPRLENLLGVSGQGAARVLEDPRWHVVLQVCSELSAAENVRLLADAVFEGESSYLSLGAGMGAGGASALQPLLRATTLLKELDVSGAGLEAEDIRLLCKAMLANDSVVGFRAAATMLPVQILKTSRHVSLHGMHMDPHDWLAFMELCVPPAVELVAFGGCSGVDFEALLPMVSKWRPEEMRFCGFDDMHRILNLCRTASPHLLRLDLSECGPGIGDLPAAVQDNKLLELHLKGCACVSSATLLDIAKRCAKLEVFSVSGVDDSTLSDTVALLPGLRSLDVTDCSKLTDAAMAALATSCTQLTSLRLDGCSAVTDAGVQALFAACTRLERLSLRRAFGVTSAGARSIVGASAGGAMRELDLCGCSSLSAEDVEQIAASCPRLSLLGLAYCRAVSDAAVSRIAGCCTGLVSLDVAACQDVADGGLRSLGASCTKLEKLCLSGCVEVTDAGLKALAEGCQLLVELDLTGLAELTEMGLGAAWRRMPCMEHLELAGCTSAANNFGGVLAETNYTMYTQQGHRFLLSARKVGAAYYISQYESFPDYVDSIAGDKPPTARFCAVLRQGATPEEEKHYRLWLCGCEDPATYYALENNPVSPGPAGAAESRIDGQLMAEVVHNHKRVRGADAEMRAMRVTLPHVDGADRRSRVLWTPRAERLVAVTGVPQPQRPRLSRCSSLPADLTGMAGPPGRGVTPRAAWGAGRGGGEGGAGGGGGEGGGG
eukprot:g7120.t1